MQTNKFAPDATRQVALPGDIQMPVYKSSPVWTMSTEEVISHIAGLAAPDQIYWDSRSLKKDGKKFQSQSWDHWPRATRTDAGEWVFVKAAQSAPQDVKDITPAWATDGQGGVPGFAKMSLGGESFWAKVLCTEADGRIVAKIDNELVCTDVHGLRMGDLVRYMPDPRPAAAAPAPAPAVAAATAQPPQPAKLVEAEVVIAALRAAGQPVLDWVAGGLQHPAPANVQAVKDATGAGWGQFQKLAKVVAAEA